MGRQLNQKDNAMMYRNKKDFYQDYCNKICFPSPADIIRYSTPKEYGIKLLNRKRGKK